MNDLKSVYRRASTRKPLAPEEKCYDTAGDGIFCSRRVGHSGEHFNRGNKQRWKNDSKPRLSDEEMAEWNMR